MAYPIPKSEADLLTMQVDGEAEGPYLEYKSGRLFESKNEKIFETLSKEITAFGNSAGGVIIIGVEEDSNRCISEIKPIFDETKTDSWIENGLLTRINPPISLNINTLDVRGGKIFVIDVPASHAAPHQAGDRKYYARRLYRVDPLLAFEINDIRRRTIENPLRVSMSLSFSEGLINFTIRNEGFVPVFDISINVDGIDNSEIASQWSPPLGRPYSEPFRVLYPESEHHFLGSGYDFFQKKLTDSFVVNLTFTDSEGVAHKKIYQHYLKDYEGTQTQRTNSEKIMKGIETQLTGVNETLRGLLNANKNMNESFVHSSGLNLSKTTLDALSKSQDWKWSGANLSPMALAEVLEVDTDTAYKVYRGLYGQQHIMGGRNIDLSELDVDEDVKDKIQKKLIILSGER